MGIFEYSHQPLARRSSVRLCDSRCRIVQPDCTNETLPILSAKSRACVKYYSQFRTKDRFVLC
jgi:hypothetical protein